MGEHSQIALGALPSPLFSMTLCCSFRRPAGGPSSRSSCYCPVACRFKCIAIRSDMSPELIGHHVSGPPGKAGVPGALSRLGGNSRPDPCEDHACDFPSLRSAIGRCLVSPPPQPNRLHAIYNQPACRTERRLKAF